MQFDSWRLAHGVIHKLIRKCIGREGFFKCRSTPQYILYGKWGRSQKILILGSIINFVYVEWEQPFILQKKLKAVFRQTTKLYFYHNFVEKILESSIKRKPGYCFGKIIAKQILAWEWLALLQMKAKISPYWLIKFVSRFGKSSFEKIIPYLFYRTFCDSLWKMMIGTRVAFFMKILFLAHIWFS